ncbi:hypothetical protein DPMN_049507 [Dreissena polymorpha]|uniref:Uncharacterized protein n=1 Tax=Dreissena polymorpha TaxID=45954 RepID=A0A9D4CFP8_DREPO|nr:hypothetical protein DPMN_049507 [Dreissena polymorpha]
MFSLYTYREKCPAHWRPYIDKTNVLTNFHDDWAKIVTSRVTIFELYSHIKETNVLTKFHENWAKNVTSSVFTCFHYKHIEKNAPPTGGLVFSPIWTNFELFRDINKTNVLANFHDDWAKIVTSRVFTRKTAPPTGGHVFQRTGTTFELNQHIIRTNILTNFELDRDFIGTKLLNKFHEDRTINVASRVFTNKCGRTDGRTDDGQRLVTKAHLSNQTNLFTKFHDDWAKNVTSRVFTSFYINIRKLPPPPPRRPCHSTDRKHFQTQLSYQRNKFSDQFSSKLGQNVTSRVFTCFHYIHKEKNAPPTGSHVFSLIWTIFKLVRDINKTNVLTNFHDDWAKIVTSRVFTSHVIQLTGTIFELNSHIKETNVLTKFHENWTKNVTSRVFTSLHYIHIEKNAPPTGGHVFSPIWTIFKLV